MAQRKTPIKWSERSAALLVALGLVLLLLPTRTHFSLSIPLGTVLHAPLRGLAALSSHLNQREAENRRLARLSAELAAENARLRNQLGHLTDAPTARYSLIRSPIINRDPGTLQHWLTISRGRRQGVFPGAPVLAPEGIVGKVVAAGEHQSLVQTILAPESRFSALDARSRVPGLCRAHTQGLLRFDFAAKGSDVKPQDTIITAGMGLVFPRGLVVGTVQTASDLPTDLFRSVFVKPFVNIALLDQVFVFRPDVPAESLWADPWLDNLAPQEIKVAE